MSDSTSDLPEPVLDAAPAPPEPPPAPDTGVQLERVPADAELALQQRVAGPFAWRYAYARAADRRTDGAIGQDYLTFQEAPGRFAFALCDGVGQSYFGNLAARFLGDALLGWLWALPASGRAADDLGTEMTAWLASLTEPGTEIVAGHTHRDDLAPVVARVLERKRADGSATTFTGARIDLDDEGRLRVVLAALGDSRLRVWVDDAEVTVHDGPGQTGSGWSTRHGIVGSSLSLSVFSSRVRALRVLAYTDGIVPLDDVAEQIPSSQLRGLIAASQSDPTSDDIAILDVWMPAGEPVPFFDDAPPEPAGADATVETADRAEAAAHDGPRLPPAPPASPEFSTPPALPEPPAASAGSDDGAEAAMPAGPLPSTRRVTTLLAVLALVIALAVAVAALLLWWQP